MSSSRDIILTNPEDWDQWISQVITISNEDLWPHFNPENQCIPSDAVALRTRPNEPNIDAINAYANEYLELTPEQQRVYENARRFYDQDLEQYQKQQQNIREVRTHIRSTVSKQKQFILDPELDIFDWLSLLKANAKPSDAYMRDKVHYQYIEALQGPNPLKFNQWLDHWEHVISLIVKYDMPQKRAGLWLLDLARAIRL